MAAGFLQPQTAVAVNWFGEYKLHRIDLRRDLAVDYARQRRAGGTTSRRKPRPRRCHARRGMIWAAGCRFRAFDSLGDYRAWCERQLPAWLGYARV
jgi:hypothetical protein